jgi:hypothetical protein
MNGCGYCPIRLDAADRKQLHFAFWFVGNGTPADGGRKLLSHELKGAATAPTCSNVSVNP